MKPADMYTNVALRSAHSKRRERWGSNRVLSLHNTAARRAERNCAKHSESMDPNRR
jgi:hypothetical protein